MDELEPELQAMSDIANVLAALSNEEARIRVLRWVAEKYASSVVRTTPLPVATGVPPSPRILGTNDADNAEEPETATPVYAHFADLLSAVHPASGVDRVLTGAYWLQVIQGRETWQATEISKLLKDVGYQIKSITHRLESAQRRTPMLVLQVSKGSGAKTKSGRTWKTYKLSTAGVDYVKFRLNDKDQD
jgi:hypothetical protein